MRLRGFYLIEKRGLDRENGLYGVKIANSKSVQNRQIPCLRFFYDYFKPYKSALRVIRKMLYEMFHK
jgi:hypothetical protein